MGRLVSLVALTVIAIGTQGSMSAQIAADWTPPPDMARTWRDSVTAWSKLDLHAPAGPNDNGVTVAAESITSVDGEGRATRVYQEVFRAVTESGANGLGSRTVSYRKHWQRVYILEAESVAPDGSRHAVRPDAILRQAPQRQADASLYDDVEEVRVIFPDVHPGTAIHLVYVVQDLAARFPGEYCSIATPMVIWPVQLERYSLALPRSMADRLLIDPIGNGLPAPTRRVSGGQVQFEWDCPSHPGRLAEINEPPEWQVGPAINVTTLHSWDQVGAWFLHLAAGRDQADAALAAAVRSWTAKAHTPAEQLGAIYRKIADQVRYVGLELDSGDYQPRNCNEVWASQYGDCKDKANLLIAALRTVGQPAYFALLQTAYIGAIDRKTPSYRNFNHVIVAVPDPHGGYLFCDPTLRHAIPGLLGPGDEDRDVLVLLPAKTAWVRTPAQDVGAQHYALDLQLAPTGALTGWMDVSATGYLGTEFAEGLGALGPTELRRAGGSLVQTFLPSAQVLDAVREPYEAGGTFRLRCYVNVDPKGGDARSTIHFPECQPLLIPTGTEAARQTPFRVYRGAANCGITVHLPAGTEPASLPSAYRFRNAAVEGVAEWHAQGATVMGELQLKLKERLIAPADFALLFEDMRALKGWLGQAVALTTGTGAPPPAAAEASALPVLPTGAGELALVDHLYPPTGDLAARRKALQQVQNLFPADAATLAGASARLAAADLQEGHFAAADARLKPLLADYGKSMDHPTFLWAEMLQATALGAEGQKAPAAAIYERLVGDSQLNAQFRWLSADAIAELFLPSDPARALRALTAADSGTTTATPEMLSYLLHAQLVVGVNESYIDGFLNRLRGGTVETTEDNWTRLLRTCAASWHQPGDPDRLARVARAIERAEVLVVSADLRAQLTAIEHQAAFARIQAQLRRLLSGPLAGWYFPDRVDKPEAFTAVDEQLAADDASMNAEHGVRLSVTSLLWNNPPNFSYRLWHAAAYADWAERRKAGSIPGAATEALFDLCEQLPTDDVQWVEARKLRGDRDSRLGLDAAERSELAPLLDHPTAIPAQRAMIAYDLGCNEERAGQWAKAAAYFDHAKPYLAASPWAGEGLVHAVFLHLWLHETAAARADIQALGRLDDAGLTALQSAGQARALIGLERTGHPEIYWTGSEAWWTRWLEVARLAGLKTGVADRPAPALRDNFDLHQHFVSAIKSGDPLEAWTQVAWNVSAARWLPTENEKVARLIVPHVHDFPAYAPQIRTWLLALTAAPVPEGYPESGWRQLAHAAVDIQAGRLEAALATVRQYESKAVGKSDEVIGRMHIIHAKLALSLDRDRPEAIALVARDLAGGITEYSRFEAVETLADLMHRGGKLTDEAELLGNELDRGGWSGAQRQRLEARRAGLRGGANLTAAIQRWIVDAGAPWYQDAAPQRLPEQNYTDKDSLLSAAGKLPPPRQAKFLLLAAQTDALPMEIRCQAWSTAALDMQALAGQFSERERVIETFLRQDQMPAEMRRLWLEGVLMFSAMDGRLAFVDKLRLQPLAATLPAEFVQRLGAFRLLRPGDEHSIAAVVRTLARQPLNSPAALSIGRLATKLGDLADDRDLAALAAAAPGWKWTDQAAADNVPDSLAMTLQQNLRRAQRFGPASRAIFAVLRRHFPDRMFADPAFADWRKPAAYPWGPLPETLRAGLFFARRDGLWVDGGQTCGLIFRGLESRPDGIAIIDELLRAAFGQIKDDETGTEIARVMGGATDVDEPEQLARYLSAAAACAANPDYPNLADYVHLMDVYGRFRAGRPVKPPPPPQGSDPENAAVAAQLRLQILRVHGDLGGLAREMDANDLEQLSGQVGDATMLRCLRALGRTPELTAAAARTRRRIADVVIASWITQDQSEIGDVLQTLDALDDPSLVNDRWIDDMTARLGPSSLSSLALQVLRAKLRHDWAGLVRVTAPLQSTYATSYDLFFDRARALHALRRDAEAVPLLEAYCRHVNDADDHHAAVELLRQLSPHSAVLAATR